MTRPELAYILRKIADAVETGDSFEGRIAYYLTDAPDEVDVDIACRPGNIDGQGSYLIIRTSGAA